MASGALIGLVVMTAIALQSGVLDASAQQGVTIGVDAITEGNTATSLDDLDDCVSVSKGDTFEVDIYITNVKDLLGWETYMSYDTSIAQVVERDVNLLQAANPGSSVFNTSESVPDNSDGLFRVGGTDLIDPPAGDDGSGVLARLTIKAKGKGNTFLDIGGKDIDYDGKPDVGTILTDINGQRIGDSNGDSFFDGTATVAEVAIDGNCKGVPPDAGGPASNPGKDTGDDGGGWRWWMTVVAAAGAAVAVTSVAFAIRFVRPRR